MPCHLHGPFNNFVHLVEADLYPSLAFDLIIKIIVEIVDCLFLGIVVVPELYLPMGLQYLLNGKPGIGGNLFALCSLQLMLGEEGLGATLGVNP